MAVIAAVVVVALVVGGSSQRPDQSMCCVSVSDKKSGKGTVSRVCFLCVVGGEEKERKKDATLAFCDVGRLELLRLPRQCGPRTKKRQARG